MSLRPRLIRCLLPHTNQPGVAQLRVIAAGRVTCVVSARTVIDAMAITTGPFSQSRTIANDTAPLFADLITRLPEVPKPVNSNMAFPSATVECGLIWAGATLAQISDLHQFIGCYAAATHFPTAIRGGWRSNYRLQADQVEGFRRIIQRLLLRRPWLRITISGPWPALFLDDESAV